MARVRLTNKTRIANDPSDMEGMRQDCGKKTRFEKYTNFDPAKDDVGGRGKAETDGSKLYEGDKDLRNEMHVTELKLKQAKMWERSKLATKLAMYLLGEKAPQSMIKAQAAEFLSLGNAKLAKAVSRFAKTEYLYAEQEEVEATEVEEQVAAEQAEAPAEQVKEEVKEEAPAEAPVEQVKEEASQEEEVEQACGDVCACEDGETCEKCAAPQEVVEQTQEAEEDDLDEEALASLFEDNSNTLVAKKNEVKAGKVGVQKFEQPQRTASNKVSLDQLWQGAPDLSNIF